MRKLKAGGITLNHEGTCLAVSGKGKKYKNHLLCSCGAYAKAMDRLYRLKEKIKQREFMVTSTNVIPSVGGSRLLGTEKRGEKNGV